LNEEKHGCEQTQEKSTGELPIAPFCQEFYLTIGSGEPDISVFWNAICYVT